MSTAGQKEVLGIVEIVVGEIINYEAPGAGQWLVQLGIETMVAGGLQELANLLAPSPQPAAQNGIIRSTVAAQQIIYGTVKTGGVVIFSDSYSTNNQFLDVAVAHTLTRSTGSAGMPVQSVTDVFINDVQIPTAYIDGSGNILAGPSGSAWNGLVGNLWVYRHDGSQTTADSELHSNFSYWGASAVGKGVAYTVFKMFNSSDSATFQAAYPQGIPNMLGAIINGQRVYDPRLDSTNGGSGSQRLSNSATWTFSANPALIAADYLVRAKLDGGCEFSTSVINWASVAAAANICDQNITVPAYGATWSGSSWSFTLTQPQYTCNVAIDTSTDCDQNLRIILDCMAGVCVFASGQLYLYAGAPTSSSGNFDETFLAGKDPLQLTNESPRQSRWNCVKATYGQDPASDFQQTEAVPYFNSSYITADGGVQLLKTITLPGVTNQFGAQYLEIIETQRSRNKQVIQAKCNLKVLQYQAYDVVSVSIAEYGLSNAPFRILSLTVNGDLSVSVTMQQELSGTYTVSLSQYSEFDPPNLQLLGTTPGNAPPPPATPGVVAVAGANLVTWVPPSPDLYEYVEVFRAPDVSGAPGTFALQARVVGDSYLDTQAAQVSGAKYWYEMRSVNYWGIASTFTAQVTISVISITDYVGGTGSNLMPPRYSMFTTVNSKLPTFADHTSISYQKATNTTAYGYLALQLDCTSGSVPPKLALVANKSAPNISLNNKKYGVQVWMAPFGGSSDFGVFNFSFYNTGGTLACPSVPVTIVPGTAGHVHAATLDMTAALDTNVYLQMDWPGVVGNGHIAPIQGFAIFELQGTSSVVPDFEPAAPASHDDLGDGVTFAGVLQTGMAYGTNQLDFSRFAQGAGTGVEGAINADTQYLNDGANLGVTADLTQATNLPPTVSQAIAMGLMADAQTAVPPAAGTGYVLKMDGGGGIYTAPLYDSTVNSGYDNPAQVILATSTLSLISDILGFVNPGQAVNIEATMTGEVVNGTATGTNAEFEIQYSTDGGSTFTAGPMLQSSITATANFTVPIVGSLAAAAVTPTNDIQFRVMGATNNGASVTFKNLTLIAKFNPVANFYLLSPLAASIPSTAALSCTGIYPTTTCSGSCNIKVNIPGGKAPFSPSWAKVSGTGTLSGSTSVTATVSDTETTADGGATHTTTVNCTVTDSQSYTISSGSESSTTVTETLSAQHNIAVGNKFDQSGNTPSGYNGTGFTAISGTTGSTVKFTTGSGLSAITIGGTLSNVRVTTGNCVITGTFTRGYSAVTNTLTGNKLPQCGGTSGTCTASTTLTNNPAGGDKSYSYSNTKTAGSFTLSGSTSKSFSCAETGSCAGSGSTDTGTAKGTITDGHSNTGNNTAALTFSFNNLN